MSLVPIDWPRMRTALDEAANGVAAVLRSAPDSNAKVAGLDWSVSDLGAHLVNETDRFDRFGRGKSETLGDVAQANADEIASVGERDPAKLADLFLAGHAKYMAAAKEHSGTDPYTWFDVPLSWAEAGGIYLGELNVHTIDLSRTLGKRATIPRDHALLVAYGLLAILPGFVDPQGAKGFTGSFRLKLRGGVPVVLRFDDGKLTVEAANGARSDCTINADPAAFLLVGYGRQSQWAPIVRGKLLASGRKPWLGLKFAKLLVNP